MEWNRTTGTGQGPGPGQGDRHSHRPGNGPVPVPARPSGMLVRLDVIFIDCYIIYCSWFFFGFFCCCCCCFFLSLLAGHWKSHPTLPTSRTPVNRTEPSLTEKRPVSDNQMMLDVYMDISSQNKMLTLPSRFFLSGFICSRILPTSVAYLQSPRLQHRQWKPATKAEKKIAAVPISSRCAACWIPYSTITVFMVLCSHRLEFAKICSAET